VSCIFRKYCFTFIVYPLITFQSLTVTAQPEKNKRIDSVQKELITAQDPIEVLKLKSSLGSLLKIERSSFWDSLELDAIKLKFTPVLINALGNKGVALNKKGAHVEAIRLFKRAYHLSDSAKDIISKPSLVQELGYSYLSLGDMKSALFYYHNALELNEKLGNSIKVASNLNQIAKIHMETGNVNSSLEYQRKCLDLNYKLNNKNEIANSLNNIGYIFKIIYGPDSAINYYLKSLKMREELQDLAGMANSYNNLGSIHRDKNEIKEARAYYEKSLALCREVKERRGTIASLCNLAKLLVKEGKAKQAIPLLDEAMQLSKEMNSPEPIRNTAKFMYEAKRAMGDYNGALESYELFITLRDSVNNEANKKSAIRSQLKYEYQKEAAADSVAHSKESEIKNAELAKQKAEIFAKKNQQYALFGGLGLVMIFAGFMFNRFKVTQSQKTVIESQKLKVENQKLLVEEKQKEILDSIYYAKRIQDAHLPSEQNISKKLNKLKRNSEI